MLVVDVDCQDFPAGKGGDIMLEARKEQEIVEDVRFRVDNVGGSGVV